MTGDSPSAVDSISRQASSSSKRGRKGVQISLNRSSRRFLEPILRRCKDAGMVKRCQIVLLRSREFTYRAIAQTVGVSTGMIHYVLERFREFGPAGLIDRREDNGAVKIDEDFLRALWEVLEHPASHYDWPRPTWTIEMLIVTLHKKTGVKVSRSTMGRALAMIGARKGRPKPIVLCPWGKAKKTRQLNRIKRIIEKLKRDEVAVWADEVDVHLNPKIGPDWMLPGQQRQILTPGQNRKRYIAGALNAKTRRLTWVVGERKNSQLFIQLALKLCEEYPDAKVIYVLLDNYKIHSSKQTMSVLTQLGGRVHLRFLPPYSPDENPIERFWKDLHDNVTRNHQYKRMPWLMRSAIRYLQTYNLQLKRTNRRKAVA